MSFLVRLVVNGIAIAIATWLLQPRLQLSGPGAAVAAGALLGLVNVLVRPGAAGAHVSVHPRHARTVHLRRERDLPWSDGRARSRV